MHTHHHPVSSSSHSLNQNLRIHMWTQTQKFTFFHGFCSLTKWVSWSCLELMNLMFGLWCSNKKALAKKLPEILESSGSICEAVLVYTNPGDFYHGTIWANILTSHILYGIWVREDASIDHLTRCVISPPKWAPTVIWIWELAWWFVCCWWWSWWWWTRWERWKLR